MKELYKNILNEVELEHETNHLRERNSRVLIVDGLNTFIRSWTTNPTMNEDGDHTGGVIGSLKSVGFQIREFNPTRVIMTFDGKGGSSGRKKIFEGYKSERGKNRFRVNRQYPKIRLLRFKSYNRSQRKHFGKTNSCRSNVSACVNNYAVEALG